MRRRLHACMSPSLRPRKAPLTSRTSTSAQLQALCPLTCLPVVQSYVLLTRGESGSCLAMARTRHHCQCPPPPAPSSPDNNHRSTLPHPLHHHQRLYISIFCYINSKRRVFLHPRSVWKCVLYLATYGALRYDVTTRT